MSADEIELEPGTFLALLSDGDREELAGLGRRAGFGGGEHLMHQGEPGDRVIIVREGHVKATFIDGRGREMVFGFRGPGELLGELSYADGGPRSGNVITVGHVEAQILPSSEFRAYLERRPTAAMTLMEVIGARFRETSQVRLQFAGLDTVGRLAARLAELCERYGVPADEGIRIGLPVTQEDLSGWTGSSRAGIAEGLRTMRELGWIRTERRQITVLDLDALVARAA